MSVDQQRLVTGISHLIEGEEQLEGIMWFLAPEIG
jgi:hypothetical protein